MKIIVAFFLGLLMFSPSPNGVEELVTLKVKVKNVANEDSNIMIAVFKSYDTFLTEDMYRQETVAVKNFTETVVEFQLAKGEYAIAAFQDRNKNGDLDRNFLAYPTEPFGFSNNYRPMIKPPHWTDVAFQVESERVIEVELN